MPRKELSEDFPLLFDDGASSSPRKSTINYSEDGNISPSRRRCVSPAASTGSSPRPVARPVPHKSYSLSLWRRLPHVLLLLLGAC